MPNAPRAAPRSLLTDLASGEQRLVKAAELRTTRSRTSSQSTSAAARAAWRKHRTARFFLTVHVPPPRLVITGAVHISQALAPMAKLLGYDVTIVDPRTAFAIARAFPDVTVIADWPDAALPPLGIDRYTAFAALTHDPKIDDPALTHALARDCFYIGALGSKKTHGRRLERLKAQGVSRCGAGAHPCADRVAYRRRVASRDCGRDHGRDHGGAAPAARSPRDEIRRGAACPGRGRRRRAFHPPGRACSQERHTIGQAELAALRSAGIAEIVVARIEPGDVSEDAAAAEIAAAVHGEGVRVDRAFTGRANLFAQTAGVLVVDKPGIDRLNQVDESITFATLPAYKPVVAGEMIATVKIIPFAVAAVHRDAALAVARRQAPLIRVAPYRIRKVGIISTLLPGLAGKVIDKTLKVTERPSRPRRRPYHR